MAIVLKHGRKTETFMSPEQILNDLQKLAVGLYLWVLWVKTSFVKRGVAF